MAPSNRKTLKDGAMAEIRAVEEILRRWDPIGVEPGTFAPADEYDAYAPHIVSMVHNGCTIDELAAHLERLGSDTMGIGPSSTESAAHNLRIAILVVNRLRQGAS
jgi:hypothetical protein